MNLRNLDSRELATAVAPFGVSADVSRRVFSAVHRDGVASLVAAQANIRGLTLAAARAIDAVAVWPALEVLERRRAEDGFFKYLFKLSDGPEIEAVRIPLPDPEDARALRAARAAGEAPRGLTALPTAKYTVCVSSQAGCALACDFCATGRLGGIRSLETWEILAQLRAIAAEADHPVRGVVFQGMGEPFLNYANVTRAARVLSDPAGPAIAAKAITISTAGVVPAIRRYIAEAQPYRLVFSLGAPTSDERAPLMPIEKRWPLPELMAAIRAYVDTTGVRATLAYVAIGGVNTEPRHARELGALLADVKVKLNLIDVNDATGRYRPPTEEELRQFRDALAESWGGPVVRRYSGGGEIGAACGTLSASRQGGAKVALGAPRLPVLP
ncbi:MAG TPA: radical SAM protein [Polyangia bacterium]|nr:radical SAM protein [Polyangia bacterium]